VCRERSLLLLVITLNDHSWGSRHEKRLRSLEALFHTHTHTHTHTLCRPQFMWLLVDLWPPSCLPRVPEDDGERPVEHRLYFPQRARRPVCTPRAIMNMMLFLGRPPPRMKPRRSVRNPINIRSTLLRRRLALRAAAVHFCSCRFSRNATPLSLTPPPPPPPLPLLLLLLLPLL